MLRLGIVRMEGGVSNPIYFRRCPASTDFHNFVYRKIYVRKYAPVSGIPFILQRVRKNCAHTQCVSLGAYFFNDKKCASLPAAAESNRQLKRSLLETPRIFTIVGASATCK